ncbi:MAG TPA: succinate dehydrogenase iron-sulfur subunit, partial [Alteromonas sp.]|nr:succinate dehydrogenase iron-sulfur subunit [Alteromonas sp.]
MQLTFSVYRYNPEVDNAPRMQDYTLEVEEGQDMMVLDALILLKEQDPTLSFRRSCREGVCGSDGMNMNGKNGLACITPLSALGSGKVVIRPLPGLPVVRDLVVDMTQFYTQYEKIKPFLINDSKQPPAREHLQSPE